jgi:amidohydrolase
MDFSQILKKSDEYRENIVQWRRVLHQHPEIGLDLPSTRGYITAELDRMGLQGAYRQLDGGIVLDLSGEGKPAGGGGVALRVDMDALPLRERTGLPFESLNEGCMHACGHDAHTAIGLGVAAVLHDIRASWRGDLRVLFQAGEETLQGAALLMEEGALDNPEPGAVLGVHLDPTLPLLTAGLKPGQLNAYVDEFSLTIRGRSAHGAYPHRSVDPIVVSSHAVQALQTVVSRNVNPQESAVISIGKIEGGTVFNVIPDNVVLGGTVRSLTRDTRELVFSRMRSIVHGLEVSFEVETELAVKPGIPPVICDEDLTKRCILALKEVLGGDRVTTMTGSLMGGDDFALYAQKIPAVMIRLGCEEEDGNLPLHSSGFRFDEKVLDFGVAVLSYLLLFLGRSYNADG